MDLLKMFSFKVGNVVNNHFQIPYLLVW